MKTEVQDTYLLFFFFFFFFFCCAVLVSSVLRDREERGFTPQIGMLCFIILNKHVVFYRIKEACCVLSY